MASYLNIMLVMSGSCMVAAGPVLPPKCAAEFCLAPTCTDAKTPPGKCCPVCPKETCSYNGKVYQDGQTFKDDCNTCTCTNGYVACTKMACISDCSSVICAMVYCDDPVKRQGECCATCP